jgi:uncharacterized membrane protein YphA (DoxX/SURF4 family)
MATTQSSTVAASRTGTGNAANIALWVLQVAGAAMFAMAGFAKLSGAPEMVGLFDAIGGGQWFRYVTGALEVGGALLLLVPRLAGVGALLLAGVMAGAIVTHLAVIGGSAAFPLVLLVTVLVVAFGRRDRTRALLGR